MSELEQLFSAAGDAGAVIVLAICTWLIVRVIMSSSVKIMGLWRDAAKERNAIDADRNTIDEKVADTLAAVSENLTRLKETTGETRDHLTRVHDDVKTIPREVWRLGDPRLDTMKTGIESRIEELQTSIEQRLPPDATNAREAIRLEFEAMNKRLDDISKTLLTLSPPKTNTKNPASIVEHLGKQPKDKQEK